MAGLLNEICEVKRVLVEAQKARAPLSYIETAAASAEPSRGFLKHLLTARRERRWGIICEIKRASPSAGTLLNNPDVALLAQEFERGGAAALSVLTDQPYFKGRKRDMTVARAATRLPVLRKDFILDPYQVTESRVFGADCILLILAILDPVQAADLEAQALELGMEVLIEVHDEAELVTALSMRSPMIGLNNRNLATLEVDLGTSHALADLIPDDRLIIAESGLQTRDDLMALEKSGIGCFLIGESLLKQHDVEAATRALLKDAEHGETLPSG